MTSRRALIRGLLLTLAPDGVGGGGRFWRCARNAAAAAAQEPPDSTSLSIEEVEDLVAFGEALVEGRALSNADRRYLLDHVEFRISRDPYYLSLYRTTVRLINRLAGARVSSLDVAQRVELMTRHRLGTARVQPDESLGPSADDVREIRTRLVPDLIGGYYGSPAGWAAVGYSAFPGVCSDLVRYTRPER